jgi:hypothetical protein
MTIFLSVFFANRTIGNLTLFARGKLLGKHVKPLHQVAEPPKLVYEVWSFLKQLLAVLRRARFVKRAVGGVSYVWIKRK